MKKDHSRQPILPNTKPQGKRGKAIVQPNMAISVRGALKRFSAGTAIERLEGYYYDSNVFGDEVEVPDVQNMNTIERLELLHHRQDQIKRLAKKLEDGIVYADAMDEVNAEDAQAKTDTE